MPANISYFTHFSGNFWWTRADYWHSLADTIGPDYYDPERFLFTGKPRTACVYYTGFQVRAPPRSDPMPCRTLVASATIDSAGAACRSCCCGFIMSLLIIAAVVVPFACMGASIAAHQTGRRGSSRQR